MIFLKSAGQIEAMRQGGSVLAGILEKVAAMAKPGTTTHELDLLTRKLTREVKAKTAFLGYEGFPGALCTAVNEEGVHVPPSDRTLKEGDILTLDMGLRWEGWYLDMARTIPIGTISKEKQKLIYAAQNALELGIDQARKGNHLGDIAHAVQTYVEKQGYGVVRELCGHGIGENLHEDPHVVNYGKAGEGIEIVEGMVICIEPMITTGDWHLERGRDAYSFNTKDGSLFCHFEDTIAITKEGPLVLTRV